VVSPQGSRQLQRDLRRKHFTLKFNGLSLVYSISFDFCELRSIRVYIRAARRPGVA
jgi:hypothetical protein